MTNDPQFQPKQHNQKEYVFLLRILVYRRAKRSCKPYPGTPVWCDSMLVREDGASGMWFTPEDVPQNIETEMWEDRSIGLLCCG